MTPSDSDVLTDDDLAAWVADLRARTDAVGFDVPDLDDVLDRPVPVTRRRDRMGRRPRPAVLVAAAAAFALIVGATVVLTRDHPTKVSTSPDRNDDPFADMVFLGPPDSETIGAVTVGQDPYIVDPDGFQGRIENYVGGTVGEQAQLISLMSAPRGSTRPPYGSIGGLSFNLSQWFADGLAGTPVGTELDPIDVPGAERAFAVDLSDVLNGIARHQRFVVIQTDRVDAVLVGTGVALDRLVALADVLRIDGDGVRLRSVPDGLERIGSPDGSRRWSSAYEVSSPAGTIAATPLADASAAIAALHQQAVASDSANDPVLVRGGPDWIITTQTQPGDVYGVRDGLWVRVTGAPTAPGSASSGAAAIDELVPFSRARFDELRANPPSNVPAGFNDEVRAAVRTNGNWLPTRLPQGAQLRRVGFTAGGGMAARVPGLPAVWNPTTGEGASFRSDSMPSGVVIREESPIGSLRAQITRNGVGFYAAKLWSKPEGGVAIGVSAAVPTIEQFDVILRSVRWAPETGWSIDLPAGWEAIPLSDQESTQTADTDGFYADLDVATMSVVRLDPVQRAGQLASVVSMGGTTRTTAPDGRTVYETTATSGYVSAYLPGTDGRPDISVSSERISVAAVVDIALSVQSVDDAEADVFFAGIQER